MKMHDLATTFEELERTNSRNAMVAILAVLFNKAEPGTIDRLIYLCQGKLAPNFVKLEFGVNEALILRALAQTTGHSMGEVISLFQRLGDLGLVAEQEKVQESTGISVGEVYDFLFEIASAGGPGSTQRKIDLLSDLLIRLSGKEAKYVLRIIQGHLRLGIGDPTILDSLSIAYTGDKRLRANLERCYNLCSDLGLVGKTLFTDGIEVLSGFKPTVGRPIRPALAQRLSSVEDIIRQAGTVAAEPKYDGFRVQLHKDGEKIEMFSRNLESVTYMFPDIATAARTQIRADQVIVEGEALAYSPETGEFLPFQLTVQRKRKHEIAEMQARYPLRLFLFDLLYADGVDYTRKSYGERRAELFDIIRIKEDDPIKVTDSLITDDPVELKRYFEDVIQRGLEGIVAKKLDATYHAGARNYNWIKLKRGYQAKLADTVDVVLVGYLYGKGQRARFGIGSLLGAVYDEQEDKFKTIAKIGSGVTEEGWRRLKTLLDEEKLDHRPARLDSLLIPDVWVQPKYVIEVQADEITRSPIHTAGRIPGQSGYALRFPRMLNWIREDKRPEDTTTVAEILALYRLQGVKKQD